MNETMMDEREITSVWEDPDYKIAAAELAALHVQRQVQLKHREDVRLILAHTRDQHVPVPATLAGTDARDARRELAVLDRAIEDLARVIEIAERSVDQAASQASLKIVNAARPEYRRLVASVEQARQNLVAAEAARMDFLRCLERRGVRTGGLTAEG